MRIRRPTLVRKVSKCTDNLLADKTAPDRNSNGIGSIAVLLLALPAPVCAWRGATLGAAGM